MEAGTPLHRKENIRRKLFWQYNIDACLQLLSITMNLIYETPSLILRYCDTCSLVVYPFMAGCSQLTATLLSYK